ncbi:substrate-binding periplasmic protein [Marinobacter panjinensis]|nr:transporter substrate-binding domain-containing protein [Marinobacter panjinensis]MCR8913300.1 transporter substrate-binding domain-containing protein [Marinobacter panjinensis]
MTIHREASRVLFACVCLMAFAPAWGEAIRVAVPPLANLLERDNSGVYQRLVGRALEPLDYSVEQVFYPYRRSFKAFEQGRVDCIFSLGAILKKRLGAERIVQSYPLGKFVFYVFMPSGEAPIESVDELNDRVVGGIIGHEVYLRPVLGENHGLEQVRSEKQAIRMLELGRIDAFIAAMPDIRPFLDRLSYSPEHPLLQNFDRLNCHNTERNRDFIRDLSAELKKLKEAGGYREEAGDLYMPF